MNIKESNKIEYNLSQEKIMTAIEKIYILINDCSEMTKLTIVTINKALITVYARYGDTRIRYT